MGFNPRAEDVSFDNSSLNCEISDELPWELNQIPDCKYNCSTKGMVKITKSICVMLKIKLKLSQIISERTKKSLNIKIRIFFPNVGKIHLHHCINGSVSHKYANHFPP